MRKKQLLSLNHELFNSLENARLTAEELRNENAGLKEKIAELTKENEQLKLKGIMSEPLKNLEEKVIEFASVTEDTQYGANAIGKTVVSAAKFCNSLSARHDSTDTKELINLILGRTEVAKAEILKIVSGNSKLEEKKSLIDKERSAAEDYFRSVMAQI